MAFIYDSDSIMTPNSPIHVTTSVSDRLFAYSPSTFITSPVVTSVNLTYSKPTFGTYESLNWKPETHERFMKYYYYKTLDKWLMEDITDVLNYLVYENGKVSLIKSLSDYKTTNIDKDTDEIAKKKVDYIQEHVFKQRDMLNILTKYVNETETNWVDLPKNEFYLRQAIAHELKKIIRNRIKGKKGDKHDEDDDE